MGTTTRPLSWSISWLVLVALATLASMVTMVGSWKVRTIPRIKGFCDIHVVPRGYDCQEHKLYTDDGYMLLLHRVVVRDKWSAPNPALRSGGQSSVSKSDGSTSTPRRYGVSQIEAPRIPQSFGTTNTIAEADKASPARAPTPAAAPSHKRGKHRTSPADGTRRSHGTSPDRAPTPGGAPSHRRGRHRTSPADAAPRSHGPSSAAAPGSSSSFYTSAPSPRKRLYGTSPSGALPSCIPYSGPLQTPSGAWAQASNENDPPDHGSHNDTKSPSSRYCNPVLLMHQEMQNGAAWFQPVNTENDTLLPLVLADLGFDVWVGHERATFWSHQHRKLSFRDDAYWNFTWDEHVRYDVPEMLTFISNMTDAKVHYVGVSLSATVGAAAATQPSVAHHLRSLTLIAPAIYIGGNTAGIQAMARFFSRAGFGYPSHPKLGAFSLAREFRIEELPLLGPASILRFAISGPDCCLGPSSIRLDNGWDGVTSYKNVRHIQQAIATNKFQQFDYESPKLNALAYNGSTTPPMYDPKNIPADLPVLVIYGGKDYFVSPAGVLDFMASTRTRPNAAYLPYYAHLDLTLSVRRADDIYGPIEAFLRDEFEADAPYH